MFQLALRIFIRTSQFDRLLVTLTILIFSVYRMRIHVCSFPALLSYHHYHLSYPN